MVKRYYRECDELMVSITELAAQKVKEILTQKNKENSFIRLQSVGCG
jgi:Fe-S cluster assembly iron-binding protein IscA